MSEEKVEKNEVILNTTGYTLILGEGPDASKIPPCRQGEYECKTIRIMREGASIRNGVSYVHTTDNDHVEWTNSPYIEYDSIVMLPQVATTFLQQCMRTGYSFSMKNISKLYVPDEATTVFDHDLRTMTVTKMFVHTIADYIDESKKSEKRSAEMGFYASDSD